MITGTTTIASGTLQIGNNGATTTYFEGPVVNNGVLFFDSQSTNYLYQQVSGTGSLLQGSSGTVVLTASNSYTGPTTINGGTLEVNGCISGTGTVSINSSSTLSGTGTIGCPTVASRGGILSPGAGGLTFTQSLSLNNGSVVNLVLAGTATQNIVLVSGSFFASGTTQINITPVTGVTAGTYTLISGTGGIQAGNFTLGSTSVGYLLASGSMLSLVLEGSDAWKAANFGSNAANPVISGDLVINNSAGIVNLIAYALGLNPFNATVSGLPVSSIQNDSGSNYLFFIFNRNTAATDITYTVEVNSDLTDADGWTPIASSVNGAVTSGPGFVSETGAGTLLSVEVQDTVPVGSLKSRFMRLKVTH